MDTKTPNKIDNTPENVAGILCYPHQPDNTSIASELDFFIDGKPRIGLWFLIHSFHYDCFAAYKVNVRFTLDWIRPWIESKRIFILTKDKIANE